jgi:RloB-like protein
MAREARQGNKIKRQQASRDSFERVLIVCEDSKSCPSYLRAIRDELKLTNIVIRPDKRPDAKDFKWDPKPIKVVKHALSLKKKDKKGYDRVYCVIDRDKHSSFKDALETAQKNNIAVIVSIPCFEYWLLLHFEYKDRLFQAAQGSNCGKVIEVLNKHLKKHLPGNYEKGKDFLGKHYFSVFKERQTIAIEHAKQRERDCQPPSEKSAACEKQRRCQLEELEKMNPYTEMHWLIECLMEMKNKIK